MSDPNRNQPDQQPTDLTNTDRIAAVSRQRGATLLVLTEEDLHALGIDDADHVRYHVHDGRLELHGERDE